MHKKKMAADKSKICLQIFYEALKARGRLEGIHYWGRFLQDIILAKIFFDVLKRESSAKILFWASNKRAAILKIPAFF